MSQILHGHPGYYLAILFTKLLVSLRHHFLMGITGVRVGKCLQHGLLFAVPIFIAFKATQMTWKNLANMTLTERNQT